MSSERRRTDGPGDDEIVEGAGDAVGTTATATAAPPAAGRRASRKAAQDAAREARKADSARKLRKYRWPALGVVLLLVVGIAFLALRGGDEPATSASVSGRSQSTLLVQVVPQVGRATVGNALTASDTKSGNGVFMALPGQLTTDIPGRGTTTLDQTSVLANGAAAGEALADQVGVLVDGSWVLTSPAFVELIDKVGGVTVDVDRDVTATSGGATTVVVPAGTAVKLDGAKALAFATFLAPGETEANRMARFTDVWRGFLLALPGEVDAVRNLVAGNAGSVSTIPPEKLAAYLVSLHDAVGSDSVAYPTLPTVTIDAGGAQPTYRVDTPKVAAVIQREFAGSLPAVRAGGPLTVLVQNGVGTPGLVEKARTKLRAADITFQSGGNARRFGYATSVVLIPDASDKSRLNGEATAKALGLPASAVQQSTQGQSVADVLVILGADFRG